MCLFLKHWILENDETVWRALNKGFLTGMGVTVAEYPLGHL
jgi:hypothetical protein